MAAYALWACVGGVPSFRAYHGVRLALVLTCSFLPPPPPGRVTGGQEFDYDAVAVRQTCKSGDWKKVGATPLLQGRCAARGGGGPIA